MTLIREDSSTNSYDLIENATAVFTFSSTIGLEAAILNRPSFSFKNNYQTKLKALPTYSPGQLAKQLALYFYQRHEYKRRSIEVYFSGQLQGWEKLSLPNFSTTLNNKECITRLKELADEIFTFKVT